MDNTTKAVEETAPKPDLVERVLAFFRLGKIAPLYSNHKEVWRFLFFGGCTTLVDYIVYILLAPICSVDPLIATPIAWVCAVIFAYVTKRAFVFTVKARGAKGIFFEILRFIPVRIGTLLLSEGGMLLFHTILGQNDLVVKILLSFFVIVINYGLEKIFVFKKKKEK